MVSGSAGDPCAKTTEAERYGRYPLARCTLWQNTKGRLTGARASKGPKKITCQRDLGRRNPTYTKGQANTWWVWTTSDAGRWDWFPETAVAEGASNQPINGIALCR